MTNNKNAFERFKEGVDGWIKLFQKDREDFDYAKATIVENVDSIQHNYELIYQLKDEIEELKQEIASLKLIMIWR